MHKHLPTPSRNALPTMALESLEKDILSSVHVVDEVIHAVASPVFPVLCVCWGEEGGSWGNASAVTGQV